MASVLDERQVDYDPLDGSVVSRWFGRSSFRKLYYAICDKTLLVYLAAFFLVYMDTKENDPVKNFLQRLVDDYQFTLAQTIIDNYSNALLFVIGLCFFAEVSSSGSIIYAENLNVWIRRTVRSTIVPAIWGVALTIVSANIKPTEALTLTFVANMLNIIGWNVASFFLAGFLITNYTAPADEPAA